MVLGELRNRFCSTPPRPTSCYFRPVLNRAEIDAPASGGLVLYENPFVNFFLVYTGLFYSFRISPKIAGET